MRSFGWIPPSLAMVRAMLPFLLVVSAQHQGAPPPAQQVGLLHKRFEYKYSFKPPYLAQKDGSVPFFEYSGNAIASKESVRITPSLRSQKGMIWSGAASSFEWWEVEFHFRVTGRGRVGADGLAFWFTSAKGVDGPVFGSSDMWNGLGVFFDSFDNDNGHNNPYIMAMANDGTQAYDHQNDGSSQQLAGCLRDFRNKPYPVKAKIEYYMNVLTVRIHSGMAANDRDYEMCLRAENVVLPKQGFFGISAATGGLADDHDVIKFLVSSLRPAGAQDQGAVPPPDQGSQKIEEEFQEYQKKLKEQKEQWEKEHPDQVKPHEDDEDYDNWMGENEKELQQIYQGQSAIKDILEGLSVKVQEVLGNQATAQQHLSAIGSQGGAARVGGGGGALPAVVDTVRRDEVNAIFANLKEIIGAVGDIKNFVADIHTKTGQILNRGTGSAQPVGTGYDATASFNQMKDMLNNVRNEFVQTSQRLSGQGSSGCPDVSKLSCVSPMVLVVVAVVQLLVIMAYFVYRDSKEAHSKKFY